MILLFISVNILVLVLMFFLSKNIFKEVRMYDRLIKSFGNDLNALCSGASSVSGQLSHINQQIKRLNDRQDQLDRHEPDDRAYPRAIKMINKGASVDELIATCGLFQSEAELLMRLHGKDKKGDLSTAA